MRRGFAAAAALWLALLILGSTAGCKARPEPTSLPVAAGPSGRQVVLEVTGMSSAADQDTVQQALTAVPGVTAAAVSLEDNTATVTYAPTRTTPQALTQAVASARGLNSYSATVRR